MYLKGASAALKDLLREHALSWAQDASKKSPAQKLLAGRVAAALNSFSTAARCFVAAFIGDPRLREGDEFADLLEMCKGDLQAACKETDGGTAASAMIEAALRQDDLSDDDGRTEAAAPKRARSDGPLTSSPPGDLLVLCQR